MFSRIIQRTLLGVDSEESGPYEMANSRKVIQRHSSIEDISFELSSWDLGKVLTSSSNPEKETWRKLLEKAWEWDRDSFVLFNSNENGTPNPDPYSAEANESETGLSIFVTS